MLIEIGAIHDITLVYKFSHKPNTWCKTKLLVLSMNNVEQSLIADYTVTEEKSCH